MRQCRRWMAEGHWTNAGGVLNLAGDEVATEERSRSLLRTVRRADARFTAIGRFGIQRSGQWCRRRLLANSSGVRRMVLMARRGFRFRSVGDHQTTLGRCFDPSRIVRRRLRHPIEQQGGAEEQAHQDGKDRHSGYFTSPQQRKVKNI